jgi:hypothetical protein
MEKQCGWMLDKDVRCPEQAVVATVVGAHFFVGRETRPLETARPCILMSCAKHSILEEQETPLESRPYECSRFLSECNGGPDCRTRELCGKHPKAEQ